MGQLVEQAAKAQGHQVTSVSTRPNGIASRSQDKLADADIAIDFSSAPSVIDHLTLCLSHGKPIIIGTTGWENELVEAQKMVLQANGSCLYSPNFSIGVYLYQQILRYAATLFQPFEEYDVCGIEAHHSQKVDCPSGTAKALSKDILQHMPRLHSFNFASIRCGHMPGTHTIQFDSLADTLTLSHQARNRQGFAEGALLAAEWLLNRQGFFSFEDMMNDLISQGRT